jgi:hypothetical protein
LPSVSFDVGVEADPRDLGLRAARAAELDDAGDRGVDVLDAEIDERALLLRRREDRPAGYRGACLLRRDVGDEVEFATIMVFDPVSAHYEVLLAA